MINELQHSVWIPDAKRVGNTETGRSMSLAAARSYFTPIAGEFADWMADINKPTMPAVEFEGDIRAVEMARAIAEEIKAFREHWAPAWVPLYLFEYLTNSSGSLRAYKTACLYAGFRLEEVTEAGEWSIVFNPKPTRRELIYGVTPWDYSAATVPAFFEYHWQAFGEP